MTKHYTCPDCGADITAYVQSILHDQWAALGAKRSPKKIAALQKHMASLNASYTPEKRKAAAQKRLATLRAKKAAEETDA